MKLFRDLVAPPLFLSALVLFQTAAFAEEERLPPLPQGTVQLAEAIQTTLARQPGVEITEQQLLQREGDLQRAQGQFDWTLGSRVSDEFAETPTGAQSPLPGEKREDITVYSVGAAKQFRSGITVSPEINVLESSDSISRPNSTSRSDLALTVTVPLLRGWGVRSTGAQEIAARAAVEGQQHLARAELEQLVFQTTFSYWNCLASGLDLEILTDSANRAASILKFVDVLAKGGELDSATRDQARALVSARNALREEGELGYYRSRQLLAFAMGYSPQDMNQAPVAAGTFPAAVDPRLVSADRSDLFINEALTRRGDQIAAGYSIQAQEALLEESKNNLKPRLDFEVRVAYAGLDDNPGGALGHDLRGPSAFGAFSLEWPTANNFARGSLVTQLAVTQESRLNAKRSANLIATDVLVSLETLRRTIAQYHLSLQAVETYRNAVKLTSDKMMAGEADLNELIDVEDRFADARRSRIDTMRRYAIALARLRLNTGSLSSVENDRAVFNVSDFTTVPFAP